MKHQSRYFFLKSSGVLLLGAVLLQFGCEEVEKEVNVNKNTYYTEESFINDLQGEWVFDVFTRYDTSDWTAFTYRLNDKTISVGDIPYTNSTIYSVDDPIVYSLIYITKIQNWKITEDNGNLYLEISEYFGDTNHYLMEYESISYSGVNPDQNNWMGPSSSLISADMKISNPDTLIVFPVFIMRDGSYEINFSTKDSIGYKNGTVLKRKKYSKPKNYLETHQLNGKVKLVKVQYIYAKWENGEVVPKYRQSFSIEVDSIDSDGNLIEKKHYYSEGKPNQTMTYRYDEDGILSERVGVNHIGTINVRDIYTFHAANNSMTVMNYEQVFDTFRAIYRIYYDKDGNQVEWSEYLPDGELNRKYLFKYDEDGYKVESRSYGSEGLYMLICTIYDKSRNIFESTLMSPMLKDTTYSRTEHFMHDNKGNWLKGITYSNNEPSYITIREIEYY